MTQMDRLTQYARRIRNQAKREYAYSIIFAGDRANFISVPPGLSPMAAQAVRLAVAELRKS